MLERRDTMNTADVLEMIEQLGEIDLEVLDRDELATVVTAGARVRSWLDAFDLRCARRARTLAAEGRAEAAASLISNHGNRTDRDAEQITDRDRIGDAMPSFEDSLAEGAVSAGHLDAIAAATRHAPADVRAAFTRHEAELLDVARHERIDAFRRRCTALVALLTAELAHDDAQELERQRAASRIRRWTTADGMKHTDIALDPLRDEMFWAAVNRSLRRLQQRDGNARTPWNQMQVEALLDAVGGGGGGSGPGRGGSASGGAGSATTAGAGSVPTSAVDHPPTPVGDIARDLAAAVDAATARHRGTVVDRGTPDAADSPHSATGHDRAGGSRCRCGGGTEGELRAIEQRVPEVSLLTDLATLVDGLHDRSISETENGVPLPVSTVRRLCCDAEIVPVVMNGRGEVLDVGRSKRTVSRAQRRALRSMHRTCAHPDCSVPFADTKAHHIRWWWRDLGPTDIDNLIPLCERHHHLVHEGGWTLTMSTRSPERIATWIRPDGTIHHEGSCIDRRPGTGDGSGRRPPTRQAQKPMTQAVAVRESAPPPAARRAKS
jgi:hypothetical protein